jgi:hypothetical protein
MVQAPGAVQQLRIMFRQESRNKHALNGDEAESCRQSEFGPLSSASSRRYPQFSTVSRRPPISDTALTPQAA